ncbi:MAG: flagellar protein FlaG [Nitrospirae bacterium]|nr:flagellar protein FlaG [Nitrospirota bacterium]
MPNQQDLHPGRGNHRKGRKNRTGLCLSIYLNKKTDELSVKVIDNESLEIKKEIPSSELQDIKERIDEIAGVLFNKKKIQITHHR